MSLLRYAVRPCTCPDSSVLAVRGSGLGHIMSAESLDVIIGVPIMLQMFAMRTRQSARTFSVDIMQILIIWRSTSSWACWQFATMMKLREGTETGNTNEVNE